MAQSYLLMHYLFSSAGWQRWREHRKLPLFPEAVHDPLAEGSGVQRHNSWPEEVRNSWFIWQANARCAWCNKCLFVASNSCMAHFWKVERKSVFSNTKRQPRCEWCMHRWSVVSVTKRMGLIKFSCLLWCSWVKLTADVKSLRTKSYWLHI